LLGSVRFIAAIALFTSSSFHKGIVTHIVT
jgi:hypothetical protein